MTLGAVLLLGVALSAPAAPPGAPAARGVPAAAPCTKYRVQAERNELAPDETVAAWASAALERAALRDDRARCFVHVRITAGPTRTSGREDGFVAHVALSTRRFQKDGKLVTREKGKLFVEPLRETVVEKARAFVEEYVAALATPAPPERERPAGAAFTDEG